MDMRETENQEYMGIPPTEDLMREHGVLVRIMLIYKKVAESLFSIPTDIGSLNAVLYQTAVITQQFIDDYHQSLEENYVFPLFLRARKQVHLVNTLLEQHKAGRNMTADILQLTSTLDFSYNYYDYRMQMGRILPSYVRMYEPHIGREDTVLFPAVRELVTPEEFSKMGEAFEAIEERRFGKNGFQRMVNQIATQEKILGIYDLSQFTPAEFT